MNESYVFACHVSQASAVWINVQMFLSINELKLKSYTTFQSIMLVSNTCLAPETVRQWRNDRCAPNCAVCLPDASTEWSTAWCASWSGSTIAPTSTRAQASPHSRACPSPGVSAQPFAPMTDRETDWQTDRQTDRQTDWLAGVTTKSKSTIVYRPTLSTDSVDLKRPYKWQGQTAVGREPVWPSGKV